MEMAAVNIIAPDHKKSVDSILAAPTPNSGVSLLGRASRSGGVLLPVSRKRSINAN